MILKHSIAVCHIGTTIRKKKERKTKETEAQRNKQGSQEHQFLANK